MRNNSFDLLRLMAATFVLFSHCFVLSGHAQAEPVDHFTRYGAAATIAVDIFFTISGYLVVASYLRSRNAADYLFKRALRLLPALWCAVLLTALLLGPAVTRLAPAAYFGQPLTWRYLGNLYLGVGYFLPGVFEGNPFPNIVNGSLWTLPPEVLMYLLVMALGVAGWLNRTACLAALLFFVGLCLLGSPWLAPYSAPLAALLYEITRFGIFFFAGGVLRFVPPQALAPPYVVWASAALLVLLADTVLAPIWLMLLLPVLVIALARRPSKASVALSRVGDLSYGVYLYAFPVQQTVAWALGPAVSPGLVFACAMPLTLALAFVSWHLVEKPCLRLKTRLFADQVTGDGSAVRPELVSQPASLVASTTAPPRHTSPS